MAVEEAISQRRPMVEAEMVVVNLRMEEEAVTSRVVVSVQPTRSSRRRMHGEFDC